MFGNEALSLSIKVNESDLNSFDWAIFLMNNEIASRDQDRRCLLNHFVKNINIYIIYLHFASCSLTAHYDRTNQNNYVLWIKLKCRLTVISKQIKNQIRSILRLAKVNNQVP